jgi:NAD(P)-dependent dehydrogenase (short-subunit alcohol dehydrogenase family)
MRRYGPAEELAAVVALLPSDEASYVTGTTTEISGSTAGVAARARCIG